MHGYAIQRSVRQSPHKNVNEAYAILQFNKKLAARQIAKTLKSAVANAEQAAERENEAFDVDQLVVVDAQVDMGTPLKRHHAAAQGRATPIRVRPHKSGATGGWTIELPRHWAAQHPLTDQSLQGEVAEWAGSGLFRQSGYELA